MVVPVFIRLVNNQQASLLKGTLCGMDFFFPKHLEVFSFSKFVLHLSRRFDIDELGFNLNQTVISPLWFVQFSVGSLRCPGIRS